MGVVQSRHGSGTYIPDGPPSLGSEPLSFLAALHGFTRDEMYEARRILEVEAAGLAAERATLGASRDARRGSRRACSRNRDNPHLFLVHDINFHRSVGRVGEEPDRRRRWSAWSRRSTTSGAAKPRSARRDRDLRDAAEAHRRIYQAIRARDPDGARRAMNEHLLQASRYQAQEPASPDPVERSRRAAPVRARPKARTDTFRMTRSLFDLTGKTAVVVGGTSGIGRVLALGLADAGADVVATARRQNLVDEVAAEIERRGRRTLRIASDVADEASLASLRDAVLAEFGHVDVVVSCAGHDAQGADARDGHGGVAAHRRRRT